MMEILGRKVEAIDYGKDDIGLLTVYVNQKEGDCRAETDKVSPCLNDCGKKFVIARFFGDRMLSLKALVQEEITTFPELVGHLKSLSDLERMAGYKDYNLSVVGKGKTLSYQGMDIATYCPCGLGANREIFTDDIKKTVTHLEENIQEVYRISVRRPVAELIDDPIISRFLHDQEIETLARTVFGEETVSLLNYLRQAKAQRN